MRLEEAFERFIDSLRAAKRSPHTVDGYRRDLAMVAELLVDPVDKTVTDMELADIDLAGLRHAFAIRAELSSPATMARTHSVWSRLYRFLRTEGLVTTNLLEEIERAKVGTARPRSIEHTDLAQRLLDAAGTEPQGRVSTRWPTRDAALVACLMTTGVRLFGTGWAQLRVGDRRAGCLSA